MMFFPWKRILHRRTAWFSLLVIFTLGLVAVLAPWLAPHDPYKMNAGRSRTPPMWVQNPFNPGVPEHPLGTDYSGRDVLSRVIYGTRTAYFLALMAVSLAALMGTLLGLIAGYAGGRIDSGIMFLADLTLSLPGLMFMVIIVLIFRNNLTPTWFHGLLTLVVGYAAVSWVSLARLIRINVLQIESQLFVEAAVSIGASPWRIISKHLLPNVQHVILVWIINNIPAVILLEAVLGYIGVNVTTATGGADFMIVSWGGVFFSGRSMLNSNPMILVIPSVCILLLSMSFILLGDLLNETTRQAQY